MNEFKIYNDITDYNRRKYAYEKAIEAYWKHIDRYHTWMNYYSLFNGALFVGYCTLLTATTILASKSPENVSLLNSNIISLSNDYQLIIIVLCLIGLISSICWRLSLSGHMKWEKNWMNIIELYEKSMFGIYTIINMSVNDMVNLTDTFQNHQLSRGEQIKAFSTHTITSIFIETVILGWSLCTLIIIYKIESIKCKCAILWISTLFILLYVIRIFYYICRKGFYSNINGKVWINKFI